MKGLYIEVCEAPGNGASGARALAAAPGAETDDVFCKRSNV